MLTPAAFHRAALAALRDAVGAERAAAVEALASAEPSAVTAVLCCFARAVRQIREEAPENEVRDTLRALFVQLAMIRVRTAQRRAVA